MKQCHSVISAPISHFINASLVTASFPQSLKITAVTPVLKKPNLDPSVLSNYRPISNFPFIAKLLESTVASQLRSFLVANIFFDPFQSGFRPQHSTETALVKVVNDLLLSCDTGSLSLLLLLDLSSAFDTLISHDLLISQLSAVGISGTALSWLSSYLYDRQFYISARDFRSPTAPLKQGVPQGSVLGPLLFIIYILPLGQILQIHGFSYHFYADDIQLYTSCRPSLSNPPKSTISVCVQDIKTWLNSNFLKLNMDKTEIIIIGIPSLTTKVPADFTCDITGTSIAPSSTVRNLGVMFDPSLSFLSHINSLSKLAFFHLRRIVQLRPFISINDAESLIHAFVSSRLDYCNALFIGLPATSISRLQYIQNSAARILTRTKCSSHITPILANLH